ncbi:ABC transporter substrate-binding protein [Asticcacaulis endophyticus]|uniref:ABC transporter substrate-binding protein n=1 Tax=Asticcacaulis endophyticus TaxID=1395890 RepID=A0A918Q447_9CAUL|nr:ABC transporter substrate-binding protein [Asticcacaulis endophyticus]GGZ31102.1 ABC transporter substrate-binding protein [Asticcacaulis endophyticus]
MAQDLAHRRDVLTGLTATAAGLWLPQTVQAQPKPKRGGRIRVACMSSSMADTLDPAKGALSTDYVRHYMFYSGLTQYDKGLTYKLALAQSIETKDRITWVVTLRKGVVFHDGARLKPADVVYSINRHKNPDTSSKVKPIAEQFAQVSQTGPSEVTIRLTTANADLPMILAASHFVIIKAGTTDFKTAIGTGPYRCTQFKPGVRTVGTRFDNYWKSGLPYLDEIELIGIPDEVSRVNALLSGDVQLISPINPRSTRRVRGSNKHTVVETKSSLYTDLIVRQDAFGGEDFTLGIKHLLNRQLISKALFRGFATIGNDQPIAPNNPYYLEGLPQRTFDPDKARFHFKRAGIGRTRVPLFASPAAEGSVEMAMIMQEAGANLGLNLEVKRVPADGYWSHHWMKHPLTFGNINPRPTADLVFSLFFKSDAPWNESGWKNARFDQLLTLARAEADEAKRKSLYGDMQTIVHEKGGVGIPVFISLVDAYDKRLMGYEPVPIGGLMGYGFAEYVWWGA